MLIIAAIGLWHLSSAAWIYSKAYAAQFLINDAWQATLVNNTINKPWSWADTWPVGEISIPAIGLNEIILSGDSGSSLAFGPGLSLAGTGLEEHGVKLISAHRDTHFEKLQHISAGDEIFIKSATSSRYYIVEAISVVDINDHVIDPENTDYELVLATCYPFNEIAFGGTKRFIVQASRI